MKRFEPKITPGPWELCGPIFTAIKSNLGYITTVHTSDFGKVRAKINAKAIVALPELLEVLKCARKVSNVRWSVMEIGEMMDAIDKLDELHGTEVTE